MTNLPVRLRAATLALLVSIIVACTPGGGATNAPVASSGTGSSAAPASAAPSASGRPGY